MGAPETGHGATLVLSGFVADIISIGATEMTRPAIDTSHLGTTGFRTFIPGDLVDGGEFDVEFIYEVEDEPPITAAAATLTITYGSTSDTISGSAFAVSSSTPEMVTDQLLTGRARFRWAAEPVTTIVG